MKRLKEDGCLTAAEEAVWMSTMRLGEDEPQPVFGQTSLLSFSRGQPAQVMQCEISPVHKACLGML